MPIYVNESSTHTVRARFYDDSNDPTVPIAARYLIRDVSNDRLVRDWTSITPAAFVDIEIAASDNDLYENTPRQRRYEKRVLLVQANPGAVTQWTDEHEYWIRNLSGITND
jgi:hypothetical protein